MTFPEYLRIKDEMGDAVAMVIISLVSVFIGFFIDNTNAAFVFWCFIAIVFGFFGLGKIRLQYQKYTMLSYPVIEIYNKMKSDPSAFSITEKLAVYHGENGKIEYSRYIPGGIVNYDMKCFTHDERIVLERPFRDVLIAANANGQDEKIRCKDRDGFANIVGISKESNEKNKF